MQDTVRPQAKRFVRYDNRKIYDADATRYVTSADMIELVRQRQPFAVISSQTDAPCTARVLCQVLFRMVRADRAVSPEKLIEVIEHTLEQENRAHAAAMQMETTL